MQSKLNTLGQRNKLFIIICFFSFFLIQITFGQTPQNWLNVGEKSTNFYTIKNAFMRENATKLATFQNNKADTLQGDGEEEEGNRELIKFSRWADWYEPRVWESNGDLSIIAQKEFEVRKALLESPNSPALLNASWTLLGPINQTNNMYGNGRVNNIRIDPTNANILYACTPASQLFKSVNGGTSWTSISNGILATGVTDVAIDPTATNTLYAVTGDGDQALYHPYSSGVYKSTDGGTTWSATGLSYSQGNGIGLTSIIINPTTPSIIIVGGTNGIYRSINGGTSFTRTSTQSTRDLVFKPGDPSIVFAGSKSGGVFLRSADGGATWTQITSGLPASTIAVRYAIDVSPANTDYVYVMVTNGNADLQGFYRSTDGGLNFTLMSTTPNIAGGQGWYDLAVAADPLTANTVYAAGIDVHKSTDGGITWTNLTRVYSGAAANTHPDVHDLTFAGTSTLYITNDGGVYKTTNAGTSWSNVSSNLSIAQPYGIGLSATNANLIISGHQDNGTNLTSDLVNWKLVSGGDGMISFIDRTNNSIMYSSYQNGGLRRSTNGGTSFSDFTTGFSGGYWVTPYIQDPITANVVYAGGANVYKSVAGAAWTAISPSFSSVRWIDIARTNNQIMYITNSTSLYKTTDGGTNWSSLTLASGGMLHVHIDVNDHNIVYVSKASYAGNGVYRSTDAGVTWALWATGLPSLPVNTLVTEIGRPGEVYCGTDMGIYYRNSSATSWTAFSTGLPSIPVRDLEIFYPTGKLRAATFGRGIWESPLNVLPCNLYTSNTVYVNALATGANNGLSWADAFVDLQTALDAARNCTSITQIWVAAGTYMPTTTTDRNLNFSMINGVAIYGGFPNTGNPTFAQRNLASNKTTLSGDIGTVGTKSDNSYHVISNPAGINNTAILDGFVIELGNANGAVTNTNIGGGMFNNSGTSPSLCSPKIDNCIFVNNSASTNGGAVFNNAVGGNSNPIFTNCIFQKNNAVNGGAIYSDGRTSGTSSPVFINCSFDNNSGTTNGSVLYNLCTSGTCLPDFKNCIFWNNAGANTFFNNNATITASYSFFEPSVTNYTNVIGNILNATSPFVTTISDLHLTPCSPVINAGSNAANTSTKDLDGNLRKFGVIDMGAYEYQNTQVTLPSGTNNLTVCYNANNSLTANCATGLVKWYDATGTYPLFTGSPVYLLNITMNNAYKVRCDDGICTSDFVDVSVSVNPIPPTPSVVQIDTTIAVGENLTLTALGCLSGGGNYVQWYNAGNNSLVTMPISPILTTSYYAKCVETTNSVACEGTKSGNVEVSIADIVSIITGNWENSSIWNLGRVPYATDFVIIGNNHTVTVTTDGAAAKKILYRNNAKISLESDTVKLKLGN